MKFVCDRCQTRYSIADEKVRQKILRIRCKTCSNVIVVQGELGAAPTAAVTADAAPARTAPAAPSAVPAATRPALSAHASSLPSLRPPAIVNKPAGPSVSGAGKAVTPKPLSVAPAKVTAVPPPPPPGETLDALGGRVEWYVAVGGVRSGPFSRVEASRKIAACDPNSVVHVWKEGMSGWKQAEEVSVIARELSLLRSAPPAPPPHPAAKALPPPPKPPTPSPLATKPIKASPTEALFPGRPLDALVDGSTERMDVELGSDGAESTTKKGSELRQVADEVAKGAFSEITTKKAKKLEGLDGADASAFTEATTKKSRSLRDIESDPLFAHSPAESVAGIPVSASAVMSAVSTSSVSLPRGTPAPVSVPQGAPDAGLVAFDDALRGVAESAAAVAEPQVFPDVSAPLSPSLDAAPSEAKKARPGLKYLVAAGIIVALVLLMVLVTFRMDSRKVAVEPEPPQAKAAPEPMVAVAAEPKPVVPEPEAVLPVVDEKPTPGVRGAGKRTMAKTVRQVGPAPTPAPAPSGATAERPVPKLGAKGADSRPNPFDEAHAVSQSQISAVVRSKTNQAGLKSCYERALKMDNHLTSGRIDVTVSIGTSGMVQRVVVNAPSSFILVEPCIKNAVKRWVFPPSSEEYATNFPLIMQGGM